MTDEVAQWKQRIIERKAKGQTITDWYYLPWSKQLPEQCQLKHKHKKCFKK